MLLPTQTASLTLGLRELHASIRLGESCLSTVEATRQLALASELRRLRDKLLMVTGPGEFATREWLAVSTVSRCH